MSDERGAVAIWGIGMILVLFGFAGLAIDTWRVFTERQALAGLADSASIAGATAIDAAEFRATGEVRLDEDEARHRAAAYLADHAPELAVPALIGFPAEGIEVVLERQVDITLLGVFLSDDAVRLRVSAFSTPGERSIP